MTPAKRCKAHLFSGGFVPAPGQEGSQRHRNIQIRLPILTLETSRKFPRIPAFTRDFWILSL